MKRNDVAKSVEWKVNDVIKKASDLLKFKPIIKTKTKNVQWVTRT